MGQSQIDTIREVFKLYPSDVFLAVAVVIAKAPNKLSAYDNGDSTHVVKSEQWLRLENNQIHKLTDLVKWTNRKQKLDENYTYIRAGNWIESSKPRKLQNALKCTKRNF